MNNWHRKIWTLDPIGTGSPLTGLFKPGGTNEFWLEPFIDPQFNTLQFKVQFKPGEMVDGWSSCTLEPFGSAPFSGSQEPDNTTERLEGPITIGAQDPITLKIYMAVNGPNQQLRIERKSKFSMKGPPDTGGATAHN
jgi:hypothetical protein